MFRFWWKQKVASSKSKSFENSSIYSKDAFILTDIHWSDSPWSTCEWRPLLITYLARGFELATFWCTAAKTAEVQCTPQFLTEHLGFGRDSLRNHPWSPLPFSQHRGQASPWHFCPLAFITILLILPSSHVIDSDHNEVFSRLLWECDSFNHYSWAVMILLCHSCKNPKLDRDNGIP